MERQECERCFEISCVEIDGMFLCEDCANDVLVEKGKRCRIHTDTRTKKDVAREAARRIKADLEAADCEESFTVKETVNMEVTCGCGDFEAVEQLENEDYKAPMEYIDLEFSAAMAEVFARGVKNGRKLDCWKNLDLSYEFFMEYKAKILRHLLNSERRFFAGKYDDAAEHMAAVACDANIIHYHLKK